MAGKRFFARGQFVELVAGRKTRVGDKSLRNKGLQDAKQGNC